MGEIEIINFHKRCNKKARKVSQPKKASGSPKSNEPKKVSGPIDDSSKEGQNPKKISRSVDQKKPLQRQEKKVNKTSQTKKAPKSPEFIDSSEEEEERLPQDDKERKIPPLLGVKEEVESFFDLQKDSKHLTIKKKLAKVVFIKGPYKDYELSYVALCDAKYFKKVLKMSGLEKKAKDLIKQALAKT